MTSKHKDFIKLRLCTILLLIATSTSTYAAFIYSDVGNGGQGDWDQASTWDLPRVPADQDTIIIKANETVIIDTDIVINDVLIIVRGTLHFDSGWFLDPGTMTLNASSYIVVETGGTMEVNNFSGIRVNFGGGISEWSGTAPVNGPAYMTENVLGLVPSALGGGGGVLPSGYSTVLPIELLSFEATIEGNQVSIFWASATETNNDFYTIERSTDAINWEIIGEIAGAGTSKEQIDYYYNDNNPFPGISYYRLKQTDFDGQFEYFDPSVVLYEPEDLFKVYPNPASDVLHISTSSDLSDAVILLKNANGQVMDVESDVSWHQASVHVSDLQRGVYILELVFAQSTLTKRIVKR